MIQFIYQYGISDYILNHLSTDHIIYTAWINAKKEAELHMYLKGGHGFGMRKQNLPTDTWIERFGEWLLLRGLLNK